MMGCLARKAMRTALFGCLMAAGAAAHAIPIVNRTFSLVNDNDGRYAVGSLIATGTFTTSSTVVTGGTFDTVSLTELVVLDQTLDNGFGNFFFGVPGANTLVFNELVALLDPGTQSFVGLNGSLMTTNDPTLTLVLNGPTVGTSIGGPSRFTIQNMTTPNGESGIQSLPEPGAIALFGVGLVAFGAARLRRVGNLA